MTSSSTAKLFSNRALAESGGGGEAVAFIQVGRVAVRRVSNARAAALMVACAVGIVVAAFILAQRLVRSDLQAQGARQLQLIALDLESALDKFETLPYVLSYLPDAAHVLAQPSDPAGVERLNVALEAIQRQSKVAAIYLMNHDGLTVASSN